MPRAAGLLPARHGGILFRLLVFLAVLFAVAALAWMLFLPVVVTTQLRERTGFDATVQSLAVNPFTGVVELRGLVLTNPPAFPERDFLEIRRFSADAEMLSLFSSRPVFTSVTVDVARVTLVKLAGPQTNVTAFSHNLASGGPASPSPTRPAGGFLIHRLAVRVDELVIADHSGSGPAVQDYRLAFNQSYTEVTSVRQLFGPAALQNLLPARTALRGFLPSAMGEALGGTMRDTVKSGATLLKDAGRKAGEKLRGYLDALEESKKP